MFLEKSTYPWFLKLGKGEVQIISRSLMVAADSGELNELEAEDAEKMHGNMERIIKKQKEKDRMWREQRDSRNKRSSFNYHSEIGQDDDDDDDLPD